MYSAAMSLIFGAAGLFTAKRMAQRSRARLALFWASVTAVQLVEAAVLLTPASCASSKRLATALHMTLVIVLTFQPLLYARFVAQRSRERATLLYLHWAVSAMLRASATVGYLSSGTTHDLFAPERALRPYGVPTLCMHRGPTGFLKWNTGFISGSSPFLPP